MLDVLRGEVREVADAHCREPTHAEAMLRALARPGFALHPEAPCRAGALALIAYQAISGKLSGAAVRGAAAVELLMESAYMFDHVADQEVDPTCGVSPGEELTLALSILICGLAAACEAVRCETGATCDWPALTQLFKSCIGACGGQFLDAYLEKCDLSSTDEALEMTCLKAGGLGRLAAEFGASLAGGELETVNLLGQFGFNVFSYAQLIDDLRDACPEDGSPGDLARQKKTLPVVFFRNSVMQSDSVIESSLGGGNETKSSELGTDRLRIRQELEASGAQAFCAIVAEAFLNRAKVNLACLMDRVAGVEYLEEFLDSVVATSTESAAVY